MPRILYLGLEVPEQLKGSNLFHYPIIRIEPRPLDSPDIQHTFASLLDYTHLIFTSKTAVSLFFHALNHFHFAIDQLANKRCFSVGKKTTLSLEREGMTRIITAEEETAEGVIKEILKRKEPLSFFWPHSVRSRPLLAQFFDLHQYAYCSCILYDTVPNQGVVLNLQEFGEIVFTSPSTVDAFFLFFGIPPKRIKLSCIGQITKNYLSHRLAIHVNK